MGLWRNSQLLLNLCLMFQLDIGLRKSVWGWSKKPFNKSMMGVSGCWKWNGGKANHLLQCSNTTPYTIFIINMQKLSKDWNPSVKNLTNFCSPSFIPSIFSKLTTDIWEISPTSSTNLTRSASFSSTSVSETWGLKNSHKRASVLR